MRHGAVEIELGTAGNDDIGLPRADRANRRQDGVEPGGALAIDGGGGCRLRQPGGEGDEAGRIAALGRIPQDQLVDPLGIEAAILDNGPHDGGGQRVEAAMAMQPADATKSRSACRNDIGGTLGHRARRESINAGNADTSARSPLRSQLT